MSLPRVVDVLILGAGAAGLAAALAASRGGAHTLVLEAAPKVKHTPNVRMSGGWVMTLEDASEGSHYLRACAGELVEGGRLDDWALRSTALPNWLSELGVELVEDGIRLPEHPDLPGSSSVRVRRAHTELPSPAPEQGGWWRPDQPAIGGEALYRGLLGGVVSAGVEVQWGTRPSSLVVSESGRVQGVRIQGESVEINSQRGVVIATGGFGTSQEIIRNHFAVPGTRFYGNPYNDGSGLRLAVSAGAGLARMNRLAGRGIASFLTDSAELGFMIDMSGGGYIVCDSQGLRYADEYAQAALFHDVHYRMEHFDTAQNIYSRSPSYYIFDQQRMDAGPLTFIERGACGVGLYQWSPDNSKELAQGWIGRGETPADAAAAVGATKESAFNSSVADYNKGCESGIDRFGRRSDSLLPLGKPPYYCIALHIGGPNTTGGPERDAQGAVLSALDSTPIPGLFSAGELGQAIGQLYPSAGCSISEALCSGISAGEAAVRK